MLEPESLIFGLKSEWAILIALLILSSSSILRMVFDYSVAKKQRGKDEEINKVLYAIERYLRILSNKYTEEVTERQMPVIIQEVILHLKLEIKVVCYSAVGYNEISKGEKNLKDKVDQAVCNLFNEAVLALGLFKWKGTVLSELLDNDWKHDVRKGIIEMVVAPHSDRKEAVLISQRMGTYLDQKFMGMKATMLSKAYEL